MGNSVKPPQIFKDYEHSTGKKLLASIQVNQKDVTQLAIDFARKEFTRPISRVTSNASDYEEMATGMEKYLTKQYDIGDGMIFRKSPLEYCESIGSLESAAVITENLQKLSASSRSRITGSKDGGVSLGIESATVGTVTQERAALAKARLQAFQATRK